MSFLIVYKNLLAKFSNAYAGVILETEGSIKQSRRVNNCCCVAICYLNMTINGIWKSEEVGNALKSSFELVMQITRGKR